MGQLPTRNKRKSRRTSSMASNTFKKKIVFSSQNIHDEKATIISTDDLNKVTEIKKQGGKDIWLYGRASLIKTFIQFRSY